MSSCAPSVRGPPVPTAASIVPLGALVSVPDVTSRIAPYEDVESVRTMLPLLVKLLATVKTAVLYDPFPCKRISDPDVVMRPVVMLVDPSTNT